MRLFIKLAIAIVVIGLVIAFAAPLAISYVVQHYYPTLLSKVAQSQKVSIQLVNFHRGWFTSTATLRIHINKASLTIKQNIQNGPFVSLVGEDGQTHMAFALAGTRTQTDILGSNVSATSILGFNRSLRSHFSTPNIKLTEQNYVIKLNHLAGYTIIGNNQQRIQTQLSVGSGTFSEKNHHHTKTVLTFSQFSTKSALQKSHAIWYGKQKTTIKGLSFYGDNGKPVTVSGFSGQEALSKDAADNRIKLAYRIQQIQAVNSTFGPVRCDINLTQLKTAALAGFMKAMQQQKNLLHSAKKMSVFTKPLLNLVASGLSIHISPCELNTFEGPVDLGIKANITPQSLPINPEHFVKSSVLNIKLKAPKTWLENVIADVYQQVEKVNKVIAQQQSQQLMQHWLANHYLLADGKNVSTHIKFDKELLINDKAPSASFFKEMH